MIKFLFKFLEFIYDEKYLPYLEKNWDKLAKHILHFEDTVVSQQEQIKLSNVIKKEYLKDAPIARKTFQELVQVSN